MHARATIHSFPTLPIVVVSLGQAVQVRTYKSLVPAATESTWADGFHWPLMDMTNQASSSFFLGFKEVFAVFCIASYQEVCKIRGYANV